MAAIPFNLLVIGPNRTIEWVNAEAEKMLGWQTQELRGQATGVFHVASKSLSKDREEFETAVSDLLGGVDLARHGYAVLRTKSGHEVAVEWQMDSLNLEGRTARILFAFSRALAPHIDAADGRGVFEHAVEGMFRSSMRGEYLEVNPALARMCGYGSPDELVRALQDINTQLYVDATRRAQFVQIMKVQGFVDAFESQIYCADGSIIWIAEYARVVHAPQGGEAFFEGSVIDITKRKVAEEALRQNEEKFRRLLEVANILPWEADLETQRFTYVGPQAPVLLGYPAEAWLGERFWIEHLHPDDREWVSLTRGEAVEKRQSLEFEYRMISVDGEIVWLHEIMSIVSADTARPLLGGFMLDISNRREIEESLRQSKYLIEQIASASPVILYVFDVQHRDVVYLNGRIPEILGYSKDGLLVMDPFFMLALAHPSETDAHLAHLEELKTISPEQVLQREFRLRSACGEWVWLSSRETVFKHDRRTGVQQIVGTASDVTQRREALEELQSNEALFRKLAETTKVIPFQLDLRSGRFTYVGPQAEELLGYPTSSWYRPGFWSELVHPSYADAANLLRPGVLELQGDFQAEFPVAGADGQYVWVRQILHREAEEGQHGQARGFLLDISEAKEVERERERSRQLLRELAARSQGVREQERINLARELHDEMGQSLTLLRLDIAWLESRLGKLGATVSGIEPLQGKLGSMQQMLDDTLQTVRRIISSLRPPVLDELGLTDAIQWQASEFARRVGIRCEVVADAVEVLPSDVATGVFRIFQEILTNIARHAQASRVDVKLLRTTGKLLLRVSDNGRGFGEETIVDGKSFGLLGMKERAWALGGTVHIDSAIGRGTTVLLGVPISASAKDLILPEEI